jgi:hypothetical protein
VDDQHSFTWRHLCPAGWQVLGGGFWNDSGVRDRNNFAFSENRPYTSGNRSGWYLSGTNTTGRAVNVRSFMICADLD